MFTLYCLKFRVSFSNGNVIGICQEIPQIIFWSKNRTIFCSIQLPLSKGLIRDGRLSGVHPIQNLKMTFKLHF
jgi:hypothetical protein